MQEFSSISVSSYEAGSLAGRLTEQSADGWSVVAIVPTGSNVTAYLSRSAGDTAAPASATPSAAMLVGDDEAAARVGDDSGETATAESEATAAPAHEPVGHDSAGDDHEAVSEAPGWAASTTAEPAVAATPSAPADDVAAAGAAGTAGAAPAGWYADPSSRFELRYWDGSQWTEHVSRSGQQYTDPPVA